ncbi:MAG: phosphoribosylaminoimidazolesuccinocarboxamide synthase [Candidatus Latescibacteria bacterium 4484_181]|nr:MAG: phosphoribosylaminoimidazolesuccinocarboxamide synthase [Candidatus Latescibacteria bacterium 4484_181]
MEEALIRTELPGLKLFKRGKVRDLYELGDKLLIIATDRISAFDCVMPNGIPGKGRILTQMSLFWFDFVNEVVENHLISADVNQFPRELQKFRDVLEGRSMLVRKAEQIGVECVVRGYLSGSGWREYSGSGSVCGIKLPPGLEESDRLPEPIFTPATKATSGHDQNIPFSEMAELVGEERAATLKDLSIRIYKKASEYAESKGIIVADTKFEFGICSGKVILIDEILSPDSSRFWPREKYQPGRPQESFDKQFVRDYLESLGWDKKPPAPTLPKEVVQKTLAKYEEAYNRLVAGQV